MRNYKLDCIKQLWFDLQKYSNGRIFDILSSMNVNFKYSPYPVHTTIAMDQVCLKFFLEDILALYCKTGTPNLTVGGEFIPWNTTNSSPEILNFLREIENYLDDKDSSITSVILDLHLEENTEE